MSRSFYFLTNDKFQSLFEKPKKQTIINEDLNFKIL